jgi:hypothetical protein
MEEARLCAGYRASPAVPGASAKVTAVIAPYSDEDLNAKIEENRAFLDALESGRVHVGHPSEGRTEAKIAQLRRDNAMYQSILDGRRPDRT